MVQHVGISNETIRFHTVHLDAEDAGRYHHADLRVFTEGKLLILWHLFAYQLVIIPYIFYLFLDLFQESTALKQCKFVLAKEDREV